MSSDRRDFLKFLLGGTAMGVAGSPLQMLIKSAIFESARAQAQTIQIKNEAFYLNVTFPGGPSRWMYDLFLDPYGNGNNRIDNPGLATRFGGGSNRYTKAIYQTTKVPGHNIHAPWMWGQGMPTAGGGFIPIHKLMQNMLVIQGINTLAPGHPNAQDKLELANGYTLAGLLSDKCKTPLNSVDLSSASPFASKKGLNSAVIGNSSNADLISRLMMKFDKKDLVIHKKMDSELENSYRHALDNLNYDTSLRMPASVNIKKTHEGALDLVNFYIKDLASVWGNLHGKYEKLVKASFTDRSHFKGIMDKPIGASTRNSTYQANNQIAYNSDLRDIVHASTNQRIAPIFAVAEFLAENKLSASLLGGVSNCSIKIATNTKGSTANVLARHDAHRDGVMIQTLAKTLMYRAVSSCTYEFIQSRKKTKKGYRFEDTVVRLNGEFSRSPRKDGSGADHGFQAQVCTIFSGKIKSPEIVGRIYRDSIATGFIGKNYIGSWGVGAPIDVDGTGPVTLAPGHAISTIATLLGSESPANNNPSLVTVSGGKMKLKDNKFRLKVVK